MTVTFIHRHFIFQTIANKKSGTLSEGVLINALKFISDKIVNFTVNNTGLNKLANKDARVEAAESLKGKIDEVFRELDTADAATSGDEDDDDLKSLLEGETRAPEDITEAEEAEIGSPAKAARVRSPSPLKKVASLRTSSPAQSMRSASVESLNTTTGTDYGMTTDEEGGGFMFVASDLPSDKRERHSGKIANKVKGLSIVHSNSTFHKINTSFQVKYPMMTSCYRQKDGSPYTPTYMMG